MRTYIRSALIALTTASLAVTWGPLAVAQPGSSGERAGATPPAGRLVHVCGADLCAIDPSTGGTQQLTTDAVGYTNPDITRDGQTVVAQRTSSTVVSGAYGTNLTNVWVESRAINDIAVAPDGSGVAESHAYVQNENRYCGPGPLCLILVAHNETVYSAVGSSAPVDYDGGGGAGFLGSSTLLSSRYVLDDDTHRICRVDTPAVPDSTCTDVLVSTDTLSSPTGSPDAQTMAVSVTPDGQPTSSVQLFSATTGQLVRVVADNASGATFSPDGSWLAYEAGDGWIYAVPTGGGTPVRLVQGSAPAWGGGTIPGDNAGDSDAGAISVVKGQKRLKVRRNRFAVSLTCTGALTCTGKLRTKAGKKQIAKPARYRVRAQKRSKVRVKLTKKGAKMLRKERSVKATLVVGDQRVKVRLTR